MRRSPAGETAALPREELRSSNGCEVTEVSR
jgi:hypothetical protein